MNLNRILSFVLLAISISLAIYLFHSIKSTIDFRASIENTEKQIVSKLEVIRESEKVYLEQYGHYTSNWDSLTDFIEHGIVPITVRTEKVIPLSYGADSISVHIDTIDRVPAREKIFKKTYSVVAADDGTFEGYFVKMSDQVLKGQKSYTMKIGENTYTYNFLESGRINTLAKLQPGDQIKKGQLLISYWDYQFDPNIDVTKLSVVPGSGKTFDIYTGKIDRNHVKVSVIYVSDPAPINPMRSVNAEAKNDQPLHFGSKNDVSLGGNWE